ncbi:DUF6119 family protein [Agrobacterium vaccinii]|uniref:DUF6119 family protein n=1 Tax=Agrobacterium vaccinii TaxID=2735528 RepID=UPI001E29E9B0|nr:DUF6119 family protein [Agrobacterium vaccinii]
MPLEKDEGATAIPEGAELFIVDAAPKPAWWRDFFEIKRQLNQSLKGAILFFPVRDRIFALTFGHVMHHLKDTSYEYDFGIKVTLNCLDPDKIKNTDTLEPSSSRRQRTQVSVDTSLTFFDFDRDSTVLRSLTGKVREQYKDVVKTATGSSSLRVGSDVVAEELTEFCERLVQIYEADDYKMYFPDIRTIAPVRDPDIVELLDKMLEQSVRQLSPDVTLIIPDLIEYRDSIFVGFRGLRGKYRSDDIQLSEYANYLNERNSNIAEATLESLRKHEIFLCDEHGQAQGPCFSIYKSLVFEASLPNDSGIYHLSEGSWYRVEGEYIRKITDYLDDLYLDFPMPAFEHKGEGEYNEFVGKSGLGFICLDRQNISPKGQKQIEPCDLIRLNGDKIEFVHVKISTQSSMLSHLFNQGAGSLDLLRQNDEAVSKLKQLVIDKGGKDLSAEWISAIEQEKYVVIYAIVTHKNAANKSNNIPLFSKISLYRTMKDLRARGVGRNYAFISCA